MGTRADFYVGRGKTAEWIGSIAMDGYPDGIDKAVLGSVDETMYRRRVDAFLTGRRDATRPSEGWPWPWEDSQTTDYAYAFDGDRVWASCFGYEWFDPTKAEPELPDDAEKVAVFPTMSTDDAKMPGTPGSGVLVFYAPRDA